MKRLTLIRHAKSSRKDAGLTDQSRPLTPRGRNQLRFMGPAAERLGAFDAAVYASPARRAQDTVRGLLAACGRPPETGFQSETALYTFDPATVFEWLRTRRDDALTLIGHNPALRDLANTLADNALERLPTAAVVQLELTIDDWADLVPGSGRVTAWLTPARVDYGSFERRQPGPPDALNSTRIDTRIHAALTHRLDRIEALEPGVRLGLDPEFLHQYRVNLRRSRAVVQALYRLVPEKPLKRQLNNLKQLAAATGELRDLDVLLQQIDRWHQDPLYHDALATLRVREAVQSRRDRAHRALCEWLDTPDCRAALHRWRDCLTGDTLRTVLRSVTPKAVEAAIDDRVAEHDALLSALTEHSPDSDVHELRKQVKKLRYLVELTVDPDSDVLDRLKARQTLFGDFQDRTVQQALLNDTLIDCDPDIIPEGMHRLQHDLDLEKDRLREHILKLELIGWIDPEAG